MKLRKKFTWLLFSLLTIVIISLIGGSIYMLDFSLAPNPERHNEEKAYQELFTNYPETQEWMDSLRRCHALRDTFLTMPEGYRCHAYHIDKGSQKTALVIHGWRDQPIKFFYLARMYERELGYNVIVPAVYAHGRSDGDRIRMGWLDRLDMLQWLKTFQTDTMVVHGVSMGAATTMMLSGEKMPEGIRDLHFVEDCGYTSVWDEFSMQLQELFGLSEFPLLYSASWLCRLLYGWDFSEASALSQISHVQHPMLFIHGDSDGFVPTSMVYRLYDAKPGPKELWLTKDTDHALSYKNHPTEYLSRVKAFLSK